MFLREYVYVDVDKVSGLASQLYDGIPSKATNVAARQKRLEADLKFIRGGHTRGSEESIERSLGDSLFKDLEADLESLGLLRDVSEDLTQEASWAEIEDLARPGRILRITSQGTLFHPKQMSDTLVGIATAAHGLADLAPSEDPAANSRTTAAKGRNNPPRRVERPAGAPASLAALSEDLLPFGDTVPVMDIPRKQLAGMIKVVRGVFGDGVHLHLRPAGVEGPIVSARLEDGRRFLDSSPDVLMSRYGLSQQDWTIVGVVGQLGSKIAPSEFDQVANEDGSVNRAKFVDLVGQFLGQSAGLIDLPQAPGFSIIPLALYRPIGESIVTD